VGTAVLKVVFPDGILGVELASSGTWSKRGRKSLKLRATRDLSRIYPVM
jgi:hypothetical protein